MQAVKAQGNFLQNSFIRFVLKFILAYCILYYGTKAMEGLTAPENYYSPFLDKYLNYVDVLRASILNGASGFVALFGHHARLQSEYVLRMENGAAIQLIYACLGTAVMSFWAAFVFANKGTWKKKALWIIGGWLSIWIINVLRVSILLLSQKEYNINPLGIDHHTWFNIAAYGMVFLLMWIYHRSSMDRVVEGNKIN